jgi:PAS domain S-box-containing protein
MKAALALPEPRGSAGARAHIYVCTAPALHKERRPCPAVVDSEAMQRRFESTMARTLLHRGEAAEQKRIQEALRASEERLSLAVEAANVGLWDIDLRTRQVMYSPQWKRQLGYEPHEIADDPSERERRVHPDDLERTRERLQAYLSNPVGPYEDEFRLQHRNGGWRWIYSRGDVVRDAEGRPVRMLGAHVDVTERKLAEERRARLNRTYAVLSGISHAIARERELGALLERACRVAVDTGGFRLAWLGLAHGPAGQMEIGAQAGGTQSTRELISVMFKDPKQNCAFTSHTLSTGVHATCNDIANDPLAAPWRDAALARGYRAMVALALKIEDRTVGTLNLYASEEDFFDAQEMRLLDTLASDISFALESYERERERTRAMEQLQTSEERLRELTETIEDALCILTPARDEVLYVSPAYERIWGRSCESFYEDPSSWFDAVHPSDRARVGAAIESYETTGSFSEEFRVVRPDGSIRWVRDQVFPVRNGARIERLVVVARDITERKQLGEQVRQAQKMEAIGQLAGGVAHDFNNLIGTIVGNAELARMDLDPQHPAQESISEIARAGKRARDLVNRLLTFARPTEHQLRPTQLGPVVLEAVNLLRSTLPKGVELSVRNYTPLPAVRADASQIHQVILNLATNSWHAMAGGAGRIDVELDVCSIDQASQRTSPDLTAGKYVRLSVSDTGKGMDEDTLRRIFEPFFTTKPSGLGSGLGLSVVHGIVRSHGGAIRVESEPGRGATFHLYFPATEDAAPGEGVVTTPTGGLEGRGQHILFVDDEEPLVSLATRLLTRCGYRVTAHTSAKQALAAYEADPQSFDLVVTDHNMPEMSGLEFAERVLDRRPEALIVLASGRLSPQEVEKARARGIREVVAKPGAVEELPRIVARLAPARAQPNTPM